MTKIEPKSIKRICVMDFDGTLVDTPTRDVGVVEYKEKTGQDWPHKGWWSRPESLDMNMFAMPTMPETIAAYNKEKQSPDTLMVMMTGRIAKLASEVKVVLDHYNLKFDMYLYNNGGETLRSKLNYLDKLVDQYPDVESVHLWEDRLPHVEVFEAWGAAQHVNFELTLVKSGHHD